LIISSFEGFPNLLIGFFQDPKEAQLEPQIRELKAMKQNILGRKVISKINKPQRQPSKTGTTYPLVIMNECKTLNSPLILLF